MSSSWRCMREDLALHFFSSGVAHTDLFVFAYACRSLANDNTVSGVSPALISPDISRLHERVGADTAAALVAFCTLCIFALNAHDGE